jgi:hypothetical protein
MQIEIEKGIPIPTPRKNLAEQYPLMDLKPGDSFFFAASPKEALNRRMSISQWAKKNGILLTTRIRVEDGVHGMRVWRVE